MFCSPHQVVFQFGSPPVYGVMEKFSKHSPINPQSILFSCQWTFRIPYLLAISNATCNTYCAKYILFRVFRPIWILCMSSNCKTKNDQVCKNCFFHYTLMAFAVGAIFLAKPCSTLPGPTS